MTERTIKQPSATHPITIDDTAGRVVVKAGGRVVAESTSAITLREASYAPVQYIPVADVAMYMLKATSDEYYCPYKGDCTFYAMQEGGDSSLNIAWAYDDPFTAVERIRGHVAFYKDRVDSIEIS